MKDIIFSFLQRPFVAILTFAGIVGVGAFIMLSRRSGDSPAKLPAPSRLPTLDLTRSESPRPQVERSQAFSRWEGASKSTKELPLESKPEIAQLPRRLIHDFEEHSVQKQGIARKVEQAGPQLPFGAQIPCRLLQAATCGAQATPVIVEVLPSVHGRDWLPPGTRLTGLIQSAGGEGRIASTGNWIAFGRGTDVFELSGTVLDRDYDRSTGAYGPTDGTAGILGTVRIQKPGIGKVLMRGALGIVTEASKDRMQTALGEIELGGARNALIRSSSSAIDAVIPKMDTANEKAVVTVSAGKEFYIFLNQKGIGADNAPSAVTEMLRERSELLQKLRAHSTDQ